MLKKLAIAALATSWVGVVACGNTGPEDNPEESTQTGVTTTVELGSHAHVDGMRFTIFECGEEDPLIVEDRSLDDATLPSAMPELEGDPFDEDSFHHFAQFFTTVEAGCYDVMVEAIMDGQVADDCEPAMARDVEVRAEEVTEILLVTQCEDADGIHEPDDHDENFDIVGTLNYPPKIEKVEVVPGVNLECPDVTVQLCATVTEPDHDPVVFDWIQLQGPEPVAGPEEILFDVEEGITEKCVEYELPEETASYLFELTVFDYFQIDGEPITAEQWFRQEGYGEIESRDTATVPIHVDCPPEAVDPIIEDPPKKEEKKEKEEKKKRDHEYAEEEEEKKKREHEHVEEEEEEKKKREHEYVEEEEEEKKEEKEKEEKKKDDDNDE